MAIFHLTCSRPSIISNDFMLRLIKYQVQSHHSSQMSLSFQYLRLEGLEHVRWKIAMKLIFYSWDFSKRWDIINTRRKCSNQIVDRHTYPYQVVSLTHTTTKRWFYIGSKALLNTFLNRFCSQHHRKSKLSTTVLEKPS